VSRTGAPPPAPPAGPRANVGDADRGLWAFQPIRQRKASEEVVAVLIDALRVGIYRAGDPLPPERDLAARLEVSRVVLRDAIDVLRREGIVSTSRGKTGGTVVESVGNLPRVLANLQGPSSSNMHSLLEFRRALELPSALLAAERATAENFDHLRALVEQLGANRAQSHAETIQIDAQFHIAMAEASRNQLLADALSETLGQIIVLRSFFPYGFVEIEQSYVNQQAMLAALESREPELIRVRVDEHLRALEEIVLGLRLTFVGDPPPERGRESRA
jgi:GntR family transcriptional repressor for pyruvate dehydrogenase complex